VAQMMAVANDNVPGYPLYFSQEIAAWVSTLRGPTGKEASAFGTTSKETTQYWNVHEWTLTQ
jgi:hypothetical protein